MKILVFIITYKASFRIRQVIKELPRKFLNNFNYKILISDDFSNDETINHINEIKKKEKKRLIINFNKKNLGYGGNIKQCLSYAYKNNYNYSIMIHGDNQYSSRYVKQLIQLALQKKCAAVTGSRMINKKMAIKGGMPIYKFLGNIFLTQLFNFLFKKNYTDCHTGYWLYNLSDIKKIHIKKFDNGFLFDLDMRLSLVKRKKNILEIPIVTRYGDERSSMHIQYAFNFFKRIILRKISNVFF